METSIRECGFGDSMTVDKYGTVISGGQRLETLADLQMESPIVVQSDGKRPIIHQRTDLEAGTEAARKLAILSNRVGELNLEWDADILKSLSEELDLGRLGFSNDELAAIFGEQTDGAVSEEDAKRTLAERFGVPPFSVLDARQGYWQERKRAWIALGIKSELGRGNDNHDAIPGGAELRDAARIAGKLSPGGSPRPACDYSKRERGDGAGRPIA